MKKNSFYIPIFITIGSAILFAILSFFDVFQSLDYRLYDAMIKARKAPGVNPNVTLIKADDMSIEKLGEWPWSRDVLGDVLIRMKEFGARTASFDIEYISPSKNGIAPSAEQKITNQVSATQNNVNQNVYDVLNATAYYSSNDLFEMFRENNLTDFSVLSNYIKNNMARDNDEYFGQAIEFFGYTWLTVNHQDLGYKTNEEDIRYIENRMLLDNVSGDVNRIALDNEFTRKEAEEDVGFTPALHKLVSRAKGVSFTNSVVDNDGVRRRMELLYAHDGKYLPQLALGPLLNIYDSTELVREKKSLTIKNALDPVTDERKDIKIPTDNHGRILINWRHEDSLDTQFKTESVYNIYHLDEIETDIYNDLNFIVNSDKQIIGEDLFYLPYYYEAAKLYETYTDILSYKDMLLSQCAGFDEEDNPIIGIPDELYADYFAIRRQYFYDVKSFTEKGHLDQIMARIEQMIKDGTWDGTNDDIDYLSLDMSNLGNDINTYLNWFKEVEGILKGSYCIIGNTATSTTDLGAMPFSKKYENVGIHANVMNTILTQNFIYTIEWYWGFIIAFIFIFITHLFINKSNTFQNILGGAVVIILTICFMSIFIFGNHYLPFFGTFLYMLINYIGLIAFRFALSNREKKFITQIASSFANKDTVEQLRKNPEMFTTTGQKKTITALFTDIQKFSTFSESITKIYQDDGANQLIRHLNDYLGAMSDEILKNNGNIDKYEGDAIISMFGAPDPMNLHDGNEWAYYALDSAIKMKQVEANFNETHQDLFRRYTPQEFPHLKEDVILNPFRTRIGINTGEAFVGLMGSKTETFSKLNYTMIGDTVNLAARLEGVNKAYSSWILCSGDTWEKANSGANEGKILARRLDQVRVVGRSTPVQLYNIIGFTNELSLEQREEIEIFHAGLDKYLERDFVNAGKLFMQATSTGIEDNTAILFAQRCKDFIEKGVPEEWDGVINMTSK